MRPARRISKLLVCGLCALGIAATIAFAAPTHSASDHRGATHPHKCTVRARTRRDQRHAPGCRSPRSSSRHHPRPATKTPGSPGSATPGSTTTTPTSGPSSPASPSTPAPASGETTPPNSPPSIPRIQVTAVEYHFTLSRTTVPAGKVIFDFVNHGQDEHNLNALEPNEGTVAGSLPNTAPNAHPSLSLELHAGSYTLFCSLPHHEEKGMKATLKVE